ncbi:protein DCL, chloroplastic isoform X1 [Amborella trichopoda]|nr:protein DCL, chloroplastic isoform X1 [Amborella trichopoda]XP_020519526.1 protein DCL, chloroplastic isoform X1 [Amborella trichopoda]XP_020519527.1 protein DCL, chloroplastic isoform X1 [Amborella trichopoda]|eukprot:XP_020519525.1 protein DCL, chloroplastic isoform X1 [Amborella trichopoda]
MASLCCFRSVTPKLSYPLLTHRYSDKPIISLSHRSPFSLPHPRNPHLRALKTSYGGKVEPHDRSESDLLRKPSSHAAFDGSSSESEEEAVEEKRQWVDWEDQILEDTVPLVGFVRMILHSGKYESGDKLSSEHETIILEKLLPYHPEADKKIGPGVEFITRGYVCWCFRNTTLMLILDTRWILVKIDYHPDFENSRCLFLMRKDGTEVDFSFWKCIKGLIRKKYPNYADSFILRHFRKHNKSG